MEFMLDATSESKLIAIAHAAGQKILEIYNTDFEVFEKLDSSPLTDADIAANKIIIEGLAALTPQLPLLSEESSAVDWQTRKTWNSYWLIDPLDGTKEFLKKNGEFTVNIALIQNGSPVWGVVYAPALNITYFGGALFGGSFKIEGRETVKILVAEPPKNNIGWRIVGSRSHQSVEFAGFIKCFEDPEITSIGSSLKICFVAEGGADLYPRLGLTSEWDTAAAHTILIGAGGEIWKFGTNTALKYNQKEKILNPYFIAASAISSVWADRA